MLLKFCGCWYDDMLWTFDAMNVCCCVVVVFLCFFFFTYLPHTPASFCVWVGGLHNRPCVSISQSLSLCVSVSQKKKKKKKEKKKKSSEAYGSVEVCFIRIQQTRSCIFQPTPAAHPISLCTMYSKGWVALHNRVGWLHRNVSELRTGRRTKFRGMWVGRV